MHPNTTSGGYPGPVSTVADGERRGVTEALRSDQDMLLALTDSMAAKATTINLARGAPPRSGINRDVKAALQRREAQHLDTGISWLRAHIGVKGNGIADEHALFQSYRGAIAGDRCTATEGGIRRIAKEARAAERKVEGYGLGGRTQWGRRALSAYTWFRTGKGPQRELLHKIKKTEDAHCDCGAAVQSGDHIVWHCALYQTERRRNRMAGLEGPEGWKQIDHLIWVEDEGAEDPNDRVDGVERLFDYLSYQL